MSRKRNNRGVPAARNVAKTVERVLRSRVEQKRMISSIAATDLTTAGLVQTFSGVITQGDGAFQRDGNQIFLKDCKLHWTSENTNTAATVSTYRVIVFGDRHNLGTAPTVTDILDSASIVSAYNYVNVQNKRFQIYHDKVFDTVAGTPTAARTHIFNFNPNKVVSYRGSDGSAGSQGVNSVWVLTIASVVVAAKHRNTMYFELHFTDS